MEQQNAQNNQEQTAQAQAAQPNQTIYIQQMPAPRKGNGLGTAGFVLALLGLIFCWFPIVGWILWLLGLIFSLIGVFKSPRGLAIAGLVLSFIDIVATISLWGAIASAL